MTKQVLPDIQPLSTDTAAQPAPRMRLWELPALLVITAAYLLPFTRLLHRIGDEGTIVYGAQRVLEGAVPYRDFVEVMGPGSFYWLAMFFKIFGDTWQVSRLCLLTTAVGCLLLVYWIARRYLDRFEAFIAWLFFAVLTIPLWPAPNHHLDSNLFALATVAFFIFWKQTGHALYLATAGLLAGITSCFIQQKGLYLLLALLVLILLDRKKTSKRIKLVAILSGCYISVGGFVMLLFDRAGALRDLVNCTLRWPLFSYHAVNAGLDWNSFSAALAPGALYFRSAPYPLGLLLEGVCLIPFFLLILLPLAIPIFSVVYRRSDALILTLPALAIWLSEMHRKDLFHLAYGAPLLLIAGLKLLAPVPRRFKSLLLSIAAIPLVLVALGDLSNTRGGFPIQTRMGTILDVNPDDALVFLNTGVPRGESVFIYPYYPMYYYLAGVRNPTRFSILMYHYNTGAQFEEVIKDLEDKHVKFVLWDSFVDGANLRTWFPGYVQPPPDQLKLEQYLNATYNQVSIKNGFRILIRKP